MMGFDGTTVNDQIRTLITTYHVGSILLTAKNFECAELFFCCSRLVHPVLTSVQLYRKQLN